MKLFENICAVIIVLPAIAFVLACAITLTWGIFTALNEVGGLCVAIPGTLFAVLWTVAIGGSSR